MGVALVKTFADIRALSRELSACAVSVGNFDGVHLGHRAIVRELLLAASRLTVPSVAVTFDPHPAVVLGQAPPPLLMPPEERLRILGELGVDFGVVQPFSFELGSVSASDFLKLFLMEDLGMRALCIGPTTHIGHGREGTPELLRSLAQRLGFELIVASSFLADGEIVSSSRIRTAILRGDVVSAARWLGRPFESAGTVERGARRGTEMGYPTANLSARGTFLPANGVYVTAVFVRDRWWGGVTNVGTRPTFETGVRPVVETHILDFEENVEGRPIRIRWLDRIRDEKKFPSMSALTDRIKRDVDFARQVLSRFEWGGCS